MTLSEKLNELKMDKSLTISGIGNDTSNIVWNQSSITRQQREHLNGHRGAVLWLTGLSGAGKSTLAYAVERELFQLGCRTFVLDGDNLRHGLSSDLGFGSLDRQENIRRVGEVAKLMLEAGTIVITALISPFSKDRALIRKSLAARDFMEIYCKASLTICEQRDVKGFYKKARMGEIANYTGIHSPYEAPIHPELCVDTENNSLYVCVEQVLALLKVKAIITNI